MTKCILVIAKEDSKTFVVSYKGVPGSPSVGRGRTMKEAIGDWFICYQDRLGFEFEVDPPAQPAENRRRAREMKRR